MTRDESERDGWKSDPNVHPFDPELMSIGDAALDAPPTEVAMLPAELFRGDESIIFCIKPSPWFILFDAAKWVVVGLTLFALASFISEIAPGVTESQVMTVVLMMVGARLGVSLLRWVSRFYVLTNRRVMTIQGVRRPDVFASLLVDVRNTAVSVDLPEAMTRLGTLEFALAEGAVQRSKWRNLNQPEQVHAEVRRAIERAIDCQPHL